MVKPQTTKFGKCRNDNKDTKVGQEQFLKKLMGISKNSF